MCLNACAFLSQTLPPLPHLHLNSGHSNASHRHFCFPQAQLCPGTLQRKEQGCWVSFMPASRPLFRCATGFLRVPCREPHPRQESSSKDKRIPEESEQKPLFGSAVCTCRLVGILALKEDRQIPGEMAVWIRCRNS